MCGGVTCRELETGWGAGALHAAQRVTIAKVPRIMRILRALLKCVNNIRVTSAFQPRRLIIAPLQSGATGDQVAGTRFRTQW